ncbi:hypothetical protein SGRA_1290 [Saprospira grandis str. Lewin]|uniref:Uncharacterized protein n=1 Tax=Saprospira grandis (strain Lewin) TaxID=984262 RepID=H6L5B1_SAPGL|nr:hypothetical protein SGRA_1290 [Saprospira grandis str. Lewin]
MEKGAAKPQTQQNAKHFCAGPSRPASPDTARPDRREGQPQKIIKKIKKKEN